MAFLLFVLIFVLTSVQRFWLRDKDVATPAQGRARPAACREEGGDGMSHRTSDAASRRPRHGRAAATAGRAPWAVADGPTTAGRSSTAAAREERLVVYAALLVFALVYIYPFVVQVSTAFKTNADAVGEPARRSSPTRSRRRPSTRIAADRLPAVVHELGDRDAVRHPGRVFLDSLAGYSLARLKYRGRDAVFTAILAVMAVPGVVLLIPKFLVLNYLGIYNTYPALIVPLLVDAAGVFIMKQFFESIPPSVEEAARIDGAGTFRIFWSIVLPMAKPGRHHPDDPGLPGVVERAGALHHRHRRPAALHADPWRGPADLGRPRLGQPVPHLDGGRAAHDHPDGPGVHRLPALLHPGRQRRRREGLTRSGSERSSRPCRIRGPRSWRG